MFDGGKYPDTEPTHWDRSSIVVGDNGRGIFSLSSCHAIFSFIFRPTDRFKVRIHLTAGSNTV